jgi:hypothetical protein
LLAAATVIIPTATIVTGLAYGVGVAQDHEVIGRINPPSVAVAAPQSRVKTTPSNARPFPVADNQPADQRHRPPPTPDNAARASPTEQSYPLQYQAKAL